MGEQKPERRPSAAQLRLGLALAVIGLWCGLAGWAHFDVQSQSQASQRARTEALADSANVANLIYLAEEAQIDGELKRLRTELRAQGAWSRPRGLSDSPAEAKPNADGESGKGTETPETPPAVEQAGTGVERSDARLAARRLDALLRRSLGTSESFSAIELIVAGQEGLSIVGFERGVSGVLESDWDPNQRGGIAKALWYGEEVRRAVASAGRQIERGEVTFEGAVERPVLRAAIGLHEPDELVQGVLVVDVDLVGTASRIAGLASQGQRIDVLSVDGRSLDPTVGPEESQRFAALAARIFEAESIPDAFEVGADLVLSRPLTPRGGAAANLLALIQTPSVEAGFAAWSATAWPAALTVTGLLSALSILLLFFGTRLETPMPGQRAPELARTDVETEDSSDSAADAIQVNAARFAMREWLADIRGCLEREAATRGLGFDLQLQRGLPNELDSDAAWLGGLVVAMGREALDATSEERVKVRVYEDLDADALRIAVDAGEVDLAPVAGMLELATCVGGRFESGEGGGLELVLPSIIP